jgi:hypothetical protein
MLRDMPSLQMENLDTEKAILAAPVYNCEWWGSQGCGCVWWGVDTYCRGAMDT